MTQYYIRTDGSDSNSGLANDAGNAWLTLGKAWNFLATGSHIINIANGNYYDEVLVGGGAQAGENLTFQITGAVTVRIKDNTVVNHVFRTNKAGLVIFKGILITGTRLEFQQDLFGDGNPNTTKRFFSSTSTTGSLEFVDCEMYGAADFISMTLASSETLKYTRCYAHDFSAQLHVFRGASITAEASLFEDCGNFYTGFNFTLPALIANNNTFINTVLQDAGTGTTTALTIQNNIFYGTTVNIEFDSVSSETISNNLVFQSDMPSPRTGNEYKKIDSDLAGSFQTSYCFDPDFSGGADGELNVTSFCIGRGVDAGVATGLNGEAFDNTNLPMIGCYAPASGSKQTISKTAKKVAIVGNSWVYGTGATTAADRFTDQLEVLLPGHTFIKMPGDTDRQLGISGIWSDTTHMMAQEFAVSETPETVAILIGVNDLAGGVSTTQLINQISKTLELLIDLGVQNVVYIGTQIKDADASSPDVTDTNTVETGVDSYCASNDCQSIKISALIQLESGWNSDSVPPGLYTADDVHVNNDGHTFVANNVESFLVIGNTFSNQKKGDRRMLYQW